MAAQHPHNLRIVTVTHFFPVHGGGIELVAAKLVEEFARRGVLVTWFASDTDATPQAGGDPISYEPVATSNIVERLTQLPYPLWSPLALPRLWRAIGAADAVHIHEHLYCGSILALLLARMRRRPVIITQHMGSLGLRSPFLTRLYEFATRLLGRMLFPLADRTVFISANVRRFFQRDHDPRSSLIFNGVDTNRFRFSQDDADSQCATVPTVEQCKAVLFVGRFVRKKGLHIVEHLARRFTKIQWVFVGYGPENPAAWGLANVRVHGPVNHDALPRYYRAADLLVLPSSGEGFPLVVQEALCCGTAVLSTEEVASACPAASTMVRSCSASRDSSNFAQWAAALEATLADEAYIASRLSRSEAARAMWSWDDCGGQYLELFNGLNQRGR